VFTGSSVHWVSAGQTVASVPRQVGSSVSSPYPGLGFFNSADTLVEFIPTVGTGVQRYRLDASGPRLVAEPMLPAMTVVGATDFASGFGLVYNDKGDVLDLATMALYSNAPTMLSYVFDSSTGGFSVSYPNGVFVTGAFTVDGFTALTRDRYLVARPIGSAIMFDLVDGRSLTRRFVVADPYNLANAPLRAFATVGPDTAAFGQSAGSFAGTGAVYFMRVLN